MSYAPVTCKACGKEITLKKDGTFRHHMGNEYQMNRIYRLPCDGSGRKP